MGRSNGDPPAIRYADDTARARSGGGRRMIPALVTSLAIIAAAALLVMASPSGPGAGEETAPTLPDLPPVPTTESPPDTAREGEAPTPARTLSERTAGLDAAVTITYEVPGGVAVATWRPDATAPGAPKAFDGASAVAIDVSGAWMAGIVPDPTEERQAGALWFGPVEGPTSAATPSVSSFAWHSRLPGRLALVTVVGDRHVLQRATLFGDIVYEVQDVVEVPPGLDVIWWDTWGFALAGWAEGERPVLHTFTPNGEVLATGPYWPMATSAHGNLLLAEPSAGDRAEAFPADQVVLTTPDLPPRPRRWELGNPDLLVGPAAFSPDGAMIAAYRTRILDSGAQMSLEVRGPFDPSIPAVKFAIGESTPTAPAWSPDGTTIVTGSGRSEDMAGPQLAIRRLSRLAVQRVQLPAGMWPRAVQVSGVD